MNAKIDSDKAEQRGLVAQIKTNVEALYNGTKDILGRWTLKMTICTTCFTYKRFGAELFMDTGINFIMEKPQVKLRQIRLAIEKAGT